MSGPPVPEGTDLDGMEPGAYRFAAPKPTPLFPESVRQGVSYVQEMEWGRLASTLMDDGEIYGSFTPADGGERVRFTFRPGEGWRVGEDGEWPR